MRKEASSMAGTRSGPQLHATDRAGSGSSVEDEYLMESSASSSSSFFDSQTYASSLIPPLRNELDRYTRWLTTSTSSGARLVRPWITLSYPVQVNLDALRASTSHSYSEDILEADHEDATTTTQAGAATRKLKIRQGGIFKTLDQLIGAGAGAGAGAEVRDTHPFAIRGTLQSQTLTAGSRNDGGAAGSGSGSGSVTMYEKGPLDIPYVIFWAVTLTLLRALLMKKVFSPFARWWTRDRPNSGPSSKTSSRTGTGTGTGTGTSKVAAAGGKENGISVSGASTGTANGAEYLRQRNAKSAATDEKGFEVQPTDHREDSVLVAPQARIPPRSSSKSAHSSASPRTAGSGPNTRRMRRKAREEERRKERTITRFSEQGWMVTYPAVFWTIGWHVLRQTGHPWPFSAGFLWRGYPHIPLPGLTKFYYLAQLGFWLHQVLILNIEARRKDHWQMFSHHIITIALVIASYCTNFTRVGCLILVLMDWCDILLPLAKLFRYLDLPRLTDVTFVLFLVSWLITRQVGFFLVFLSVVFQSKKHIPWQWVPEKGIFMSPKIYWGFSTLLGILQIFNAIWFYMACNVAYRVVRGQGAEDTRSDDEGEPNDPSDEDEDDGGVESEIERLKAHASINRIHTPNGVEGVIRASAMRKNR